MDKEQFYVKRFVELKSKILSCNFSDDALLSLSTISELNKYEKFVFQDILKRAKNRGKILFYVFVLMLVSCGITFYLGGASFYNPLAKIYFYIRDLDIKAERCFFYMPDFIVDVSRPPVSCDICENLSIIDRISNMTSEDFERKYAYSGRPVVVMNAMLGWSASEVFNFDFFKSIYADDSPVFVHSAEQNCQFFPYKTKFRNLAEVFNMSKERAELKDGSEPWYIGW